MRDASGSIWTNPGSCATHQDESGRIWTNLDESGVMRDASGRIWTNLDESGVMRDASERIWTNLDESGQIRTNPGSCATHRCTVGHARRAVRVGRNAQAKRERRRHLTHMFSPLPRLVPDMGIFSLPFRDWCPIR
eukprot:6211286-Pyramimonas_sp.AAC.1